MHQLMQHGANQVFIRKEAAVASVGSQSDLDLRRSPSSAIDVQTLPDNTGVITRPGTKRMSELLNK